MPAGIRAFLLIVYRLLFPRTVRWRQDGIVLLRWPFFRRERLIFFSIKRLVVRLTGLKARHHLKNSKTKAGRRVFFYGFNLSGE
jgi:hypothetical protein